MRSPFDCGQFCLCLTFHTMVESLLFFCFFWLFFAEEKNTHTQTLHTLWLVEILNAKNAVANATMIRKNKNGDDFRLADQIHRVHECFAVQSFETMEWHEPHDVGNYDWIISVYVMESSIYFFSVSSVDANARIRWQRIKHLHVSPISWKIWTDEKEKTEFDCNKLSFQHSHIQTQPANTCKFTKGALTLHAKRKSIQLICTKLHAHVNCDRYEKM